MGQEQPQTVRWKRLGPTKRGQKPEAHPIFHGSAVLPIIASDFGDTWEMSANTFDEDAIDIPGDDFDISQQLVRIGLAYHF